MEEIVFATKREEEALRALFLRRDMDLAGPIEAHVICKKDDEMMGGAMLLQEEPGAFYLPVFAVSQEAEGRGIGGRFLRALLEKPWRYTRGATAAADYKIVTISRGSAAPFYQKYNFRAVTADLAPEPFRNQCAICEIYDECRGVTLCFRASGAFRAEGAGTV